MSVSALQANNIYSDFNTNFNVHPIKKDLTRLTNEEAVKRSIKNIIQTNFYERPFQPMFGCNIRAYLFELITPITLQLIKKDVTAAINNYEPRANILDVIVSVAPDNNEIAVAVTFSIINSLQPTTVNATVALNGVR